MPVAPTYRPAPRFQRLGSRFFEASETDAIEDDLANAWRVSFETKITTIGRESLGIYWPREVARNTGMAKNDRVRIEVIDPKTLVLHLE